MKNILLVANTAAFLALGAERSAHYDAVYDLFMDAGATGEDYLIGALIDYAPAIAAAVDHLENNFSIPGVSLYDIVEPIGADFVEWMLINNTGATPRRDDIARSLELRATEFLQGDDIPADLISNVVKCFTEYKA